ncbi:Succinyl-diaminopimelate desuccinylase [Cytospora mali]|uniref:Succinyl-diaminopimelate desuccinylase n=1 Tax=Cytospora mali TaxID=578113 RepID=A0A194VLV9_CYTMA|nr:Succinyl-diaminopimelate desuccinylase [Valsa mali]
MDSQALLDIITVDTDAHISFLQHFVQAPSPNPPGDTRAAAAVIQEYLSSRGITTQIIAPGGEHMPNIVSDFVCPDVDNDESNNESAINGPRLVMNGHIDVFPAGDGHDWDRSPWSGDIVDGRLHGRGTVDMKAGTAASVVAFAYLFKYREYLKGSVGLCAVSDEETGGKFGTKWLLGHTNDVDDDDTAVTTGLGEERKGQNKQGRWAGDVMINAEPGGTNAIRFAEKGTLRLTFTVDTGPGAHGAFTHLRKSATRTAARLINDLAVVEDIVPDVDPRLKAYLQREDVRRAIDECMGTGAADIAMKCTLNIGTLTGGLKVNMIPGRCVFEADIRMPLGLTAEGVLAVIHKVLEGYPEARVEVQEAASNPAAASVHDHPMVEILARQAERVTGRRPLAIPSMGATDCKFYRYRGVPAYVFGVSPEGMGARNESVSVEEFLAVVKTHALAGWEYLGGRT